MAASNQQSPKLQQHFTKTLYILTYFAAKQGPTLLISAFSDCPGEHARLVLYVLATFVSLGSFIAHMGS